MFHKLPYEIIDRLMPLGHRPLKVYLVLCKYARINSGVCWPGYSRLKRECNINSGRDLRKAIQDLDDAGLIDTWLNGNKRHYQVL